MRFNAEVDFQLMKAAASAIVFCHHLLAVYLFQILVSILSFASEKE